MRFLPLESEAFLALRKPFFYASRKKKGFCSPARARAFPTYARAESVCFLPREAVISFFLRKRFSFPAFPKAFAVFAKAFFFLLCESLFLSCFRESEAFPACARAKPESLQSDKMSRECCLHGWAQALAGVSGGVGGKEGEEKL